MNILPRDKFYKYFCIFPSHLFSYVSKLKKKLECLNLYFCLPQPLPLHDRYKFISLSLKIISLTFL